MKGIFLLLPAVALLMAATAPAPPAGPADAAPGKVAVAPAPTAFVPQAVAFTALPDRTPAEYRLGVEPAPVCVSDAYETAEGYPAAVRPAPGRRSRCYDGFNVAPALPPYRQPYQSDPVEPG